MNLEAVATAIRLRMTGDASLVTLVGSADNIVFGQVPSSAAIPTAIEFNIRGVGSADASGVDIDLNELVFTIRVGRDNPVKVFSILDRLHGDAVDQSPTIPTYGFHRLDDLSVLGGTHRGFGCRRVSYQPVNVEDPSLFIAYEAVYKFNTNTV